MELSTPGFARLDIRMDWAQQLTAIGSIISVLILGVGLYLTNQANRETSHANRDQQKLTLQSQASDRFAKAIEQLGSTGSTELDIRLGGIYGLERLMKDSPDDQPAVVDVLAAFVREHAPVTARPLPTSPTTDVQAAVTVLGRQPKTRYHPPDLTGAFLAGANLTRADLTGAYLDRANLTGAYLGGANLTDADLASANLTDANLGGANLTGVDLTSAKR